MRDLLLVATFFPMMPFAFMYPWIGILVWFWISYMNPHRLTAGFAYDTPFALITAAVTLGGLLLSSERKRLPRTPEVYLIGALWLWLTVTSFFAIHPQLAWDKWGQVSKILLMTFVTMMLFKDGGRVKALLWVIAISLGYYGFRSGLGAIATGVNGGFAYPPDSFIADSNDLALALDMTLPVIWFLAKSEARRWVRIGLRSVFVLTLLGVMTTYSRAGFLGMCLVVVLLFARSRMKLLGFGALLLALVIGSYALPGSFFSRIESIGSYEEDASAQARLQAWSLAWRIAQDSPILGGGFRVFEQDVWDAYFPGAATTAVAHSIYFQMLGEHGFVGLGLFLALLAATFFGLRRAKLRARAAGQEWIGDLAGALQISLVAYMLCGAFLSRADFDLFYGVVAMSAVLQFITAPREASAASSAPEPSDPALGWGHPRQVTS